MGSIYSLVRAAQNGNDKAKTQLYKGSCNRAYYMAYVMTRDEAATRDILTASYIRMYRELGSLKVPKEFDIWFTRILANEALRVYRKSNETAFAMTAGMENNLLVDGQTLRLDAREIGHTRLPENFYDKEAVKNILTRISGICNNEQLVCAIMYYHIGMSVSDIAEGFGCPIGLIKDKLNHLIENVESIVAAMKEAGEETFGLPPMDLFACLLERNIEENWYISQNMSNEVMIGVLGVLNGREVSEPTTVSPEPTDDYQEKKSFMSHAVLGIIIGVVIGLIIVFAVLLILGHKSKNSAKTERDVKVTETPVNEPEAPDMISGDEEDTEQEEIDSSIEDASEDIKEDISEDTEESNNSTGIIGESVDSEEDSTETDGVGNVIGE